MTDDTSPCEDLPLCPVSEDAEVCDCPEVKTPATWSQTFDTDLSRCPEEIRKTAVGKTLRTARQAGIQVRHRAQGWSTTDPEGKVQHWWPAQVNLFADYVAAVASDSSSTTGSAQ